MSFENLAQELASATPQRESYLTIGVFDGVHLGHQHLISRLVEQAKQADALAGVLTFRNNPRTILQPEYSVASITSLEERNRLIKEAGVDFVVSVTFSTAISLLRAEDFVGLLRKHLKMNGLIVGPDFALGHKRQGTPSFLKGLAKQEGFSFTTTEPLSFNNKQISSTTIRSSIVDGNIETASDLLGRMYTLEGRVVHGKGRGGSLLGYPTANVQSSAELVIPGNGIYATWALVENRRYQSATSIGMRPTFGETERSVETFLLDFNENLYNKDIRLEFVKRLRDEVSFKNPEELQTQIALDVNQVEKLLKS